LILFTKILIGSVVVGWIWFASKLSNFSMELAHLDSSVRLSMGTYIFLNLFLIINTAIL
jgi:hypothetical protein